MSGTDAVALDWLAQTFDLGRPYTTRLAGAGQTNPLGVLRLDTSRGCFAIKRLERAPSHAALRIESVAHQTGFPLPRPIPTTDGTLYATDFHDQRRVWVRAYAWVEGAPYEWGFVNPKVSAKVGRLLAMLHALPVPEAELREDPWRPLEQHGWQQLAQRGAEMKLPWADTLQSKVSRLVEWEAHVRSHMVNDEPVVPSQRDLHPPNIIRCGDGNHVLIDWDGAGAVNAREEVAKFALVWATPLDQAPRKEAVHALIQGYRSAGGHFASRGILDLTHQTQSLSWWIAYNVQRDVNGQPDSDPDLTLALLHHVRELDREALQRTAALLDV